MSAPAARSRKHKPAPLPEVVIETAVPVSNEEKEESQPMERLSSVPIDPNRIPSGMKSATKLEEEETIQETARLLKKMEDEEYMQRVFKIMAFGASVAVGGIVAYKALKYFKAEDIVQETAESIVDESV